MDYKSVELVPIVAELAEKYAGFESTSVTYEKAQMLMEEIIYCLEESRDSSDNRLKDSNISVKEQYLLVNRLVKEKTMKVMNIFNELTTYFDGYDVKCLNDTVLKGIPEFFKWYDVKFCTQNTILILDYPILTDIHTLSGVDAIYIYIHAIRTEQLFPRKFDRNYVTRILSSANIEYKLMLENILGTALNSMCEQIY